MSAKDIAIDAPRPQICMWKLSLAHWPEYLCEAGLVAFFVLADCLITIAVKYPGSPVHSWFLDPLGQRVVIGLGLGTATLLLIKSPLGEASGAHMNPAITLTFFYLGKIRLVDLCFYIIAQVTGIFATLFVLSRLFPEPVMHPAVNYLISMSGSAGELVAFAGEFLIAFLLMAALLWINNTPYWARHTPWCVALLVTFFVTVESPLSGANMDPALATISDFFGRAWRGWWLYFVAPLLAMPAAAFLYKGTARRVYCAKLFHYNHRRCIFRCEFPALLAEERTRGR